MADQLDACVETDVKTKIECDIVWSDKQEEIRRAHDEKLKKSRKPSMWEYKPTGGVPSELANLDPSTFSTSHVGRVLCSLPKNVLIRLCSMLSVRDFVNLSSTCRFLHWRMFTFCTCYAPYIVHLCVHDGRISGNFGDYNWAPLKRVFTLKNGIIDDEEDQDGFGHNFNVLRGALPIIPQYPRYLDGKRGLFVYQPFCLRKPFLFETLRLNLEFPFYCKKYYDRCLPYILAVRGLARHLNITFRFVIGEPFINFLDTNDFLTAVNASYYDNIDRGIFTESTEAKMNNLDIYLDCPYARQMNRVAIIFNRSGPYRHIPIFENSIGVYRNPLDSTIIATLKNFLTGSTNLVFHQYIKIEEDSGRFPLVEHLFQKFDDFEEFLCGQRDSNGYCHLWKTVIETRNGGLLRIIIKKQEDEIGVCASVMIGKDEMFEEMEEKYAVDPLYHEGSIWWKMDTAMEMSEVEELDVAVKPKVAAKLDGAE